MEILTNQLLTIKVDKHGAELQSIWRNTDDREYLWQGDPTYWKRRSPVLFPIVGSLWNGECTIDGKKYKMSQHGFARDMDFELISKDDKEVWYRLDSNEETHKMYPYDFSLEIGYRLDWSDIYVMWRVINKSATDMHFQIGAHPAFNYMEYVPGMNSAGYFCMLPMNDMFDLTVIGQKGCAKAEKQQFETFGGIFPITDKSFNNDALIFENRQVESVALLRACKLPYLRVTFDAPVVGLWSPTHDATAPFVCIEPWYGRCDREDYTGDFKDKDWMQHLAPGAEFNSTYKIEIMF